MKNEIQTKLLMVNIRTGWTGKKVQWVYSLQTLFSTCFPVFSWQWGFVAEQHFRKQNYNLFRTLNKLRAQLSMDGIYIYIYVHLKWRSVLWNVTFELHFTKSASFPKNYTETGVRLKFTTFFRGFGNWPGRNWIPISKWSGNLPQIVHHFFKWTCTCCPIKSDSRFQTTWALLSNKNEL